MSCSRMERSAAGPDSSYNALDGISLSRIGRDYIRSLFGTERSQITQLCFQDEPISVGRILTSLCACLYSGTERSGIRLA